MRSVFLSAFLAAAAASAAHAQDTIQGNWACSFTTECFEAEACAETDYEVTVTYDIDALADKPGEGAGSGAMSDVTGDKRAIILHSNGAFSATELDFTSEATINPVFQLFAAASGEARLISANPTAPMLITYHGQCKAAGS